MSPRITILFFVSLGVLLSCDTKNSFNPPDENYFLKYFGNEGNQVGVDFVVNPDGTFILLGNTRTTAPPSDQQIYVAKANAKGKVMWEKTFGGKFDEEAKDIELLPDGNLIILANSANNSSTDVLERERDVLLIKLGQEGNKIDSVKRGLTSTPDNVGGTPTDEDGSSITIIADGYIISGSTGLVPQNPNNKLNFMNMRFRNDLTLVTDASGLWKNKPSFYTIGESKTIKIFQAGAGFYGMGYSNVNAGRRPLAQQTTDFDFWIYSLGPTGGNGIQTSAGDPISDEKLTSVSVASPQAGGGFFLSGTSQNGSDGDIYLARLTSSISVVPSANYITPPSRIKLGKTFLYASFNFSSPAGFYVSVEKQNGTSNDINLMKVDNSGNTIFEQSYGGVGDDFAGPVIELPDGHITMIGTMTLGGVVDGQKKIVLMKLNGLGRLAP
jgi:hypothetical protein